MKPDICPVRMNILYENTGSYHDAANIIKPRLKFGKGAVRPCTARVLKSEDRASSYSLTEGLAAHPHRANLFNHKCFNPSMVNY